jgi:acyl CoA:acetate/3-ketoacid CoA transferase
LENDILAQMDFRPVIGDVKQMDRRIFQSELM